MVQSPFKEIGLRNHDLSIHIITIGQNQKNFSLCPYKINSVSSPVILGRFIVFLKFIFMLGPILKSEWEQGFRDDSNRYRYVYK
jgi:hypothetical protein